MGNRRDKGLSVTRYLTGHAGIAGLTWDGVRGQILAPPPYQIDLTTSRKLQNWHDLLGAELPTTHIAIRYDYGMDSIGQAWVGMQLHHFVPLLQAHYDKQRGNE
jgi:hypothetical protein